MPIDHSVLVVKPCRAKHVRPHEALSDPRVAARAHLALSASASPSRRIAGRAAVLVDPSLLLRRQMWQFVFVLVNFISRRCFDFVVGMDASDKLDWDWGRASWLTNALENSGLRPKQVGHQPPVRPTSLCVPLCLGAIAVWPVASRHRGSSGSLRVALKS